MNIEDLKHRFFTDTALPYVSNSSVIDDGPQYSAGSNGLTSIRGYLERRPGFPTYTSDNFGSGKIIKRYFHWQRWDGAFYVMLNVTDASGVTSKVYKQKIGTDSTFQLILTDSTSSSPFTFTVAHNYVFMGNGVVMKKYDGTTVTSWGVTTVTTAPTLSNSGAGNVPGFIGHTYVAAGGNAASGYISDITNPSSSTTASSRTWGVSGDRYTDTYIDQVHIYRTEDGGSVWRELSNSPISNPGAGSWSITDNDADTSLKTTKAPLAGINAPPTPSNVGGIFANRIFTFKDDTLYWCSLEEATNNIMMEEGFPVNNKRRYGRQIIGVKVAGSYLLIFTVNGIFRLTGYSLSTFAWGSLPGGSKKGLRNAAALDSDGSIAVWLDVNNVINVSDGNSITYPDLSLAIRPDITSIDHSQAAINIHTVGKRNWVILCDGGASKLRIFDLDKRQWMIPWDMTVGCTTTYTAETSAGTWSLLLGSSSGSNVLPLYMDETGNIYQDAGVSFTAYAITNLNSIVPDVNPASKGIVRYIGTERSNDANFSNVRYLLDDDPAQGTFTSVFTSTVTTNPTPPIGRSFKTYLIEEWWHTGLQTASRRISMRFDWTSANSNFKLYSFDAAYSDYNEGN